MTKIPSISLIPSGVKAGKIYSVLPTDGSGDLTFSRGNGTSSRINKQELIEGVSNDVPRLDYGISDCPALLLEPTSTNLLTYSETFSNSSWTKSGASVVGDFASPSADSPSGAFALTSTGTGQIQAALFGQTAGVKYTVSFWIKRKTGTGVVNLRAVENTSTPIAITNEWARYSATVTSSSTTVRAGVRLDTVGDEVYIFGAQLEVGSYPSSYIPTSGSTQTRLSESASKDGLSSYISSTAGVLYAEIAYFTNVTSSSYKVISLNNGISSGGTVLLGFTNTNNIYASVDGVFISSFNPSDSTTFFKVAIKYENNSSKLFINGSQVGSTNTSATVPTGLSRLGLDSGSGSSRFRGRLKGLEVYNTSLTDAELTALTTI